MDILTPRSTEHSLAARRRATSQWVRRIMLQIATHDHLLHQVVADGPMLWRVTFLRECQPAGLFVDEAIADHLYEFFCGQVRRRFQEEIGAHPPGWTPQGIATRFLDHTPPPAKPPTTREIIDSLEVDSASSDDGRRQNYGRDGSPQRVLEILKDEMRQALTTEGELPADFASRPGVEASDDVEPS